MVHGGSGSRPLSGRYGNLKVCEGVTAVEASGKR